VATSDDVASLFIELGLVVLALGTFARLAHALTLSPIPFYLLAGLAVGEGGFADLHLSEDFIELGAEIGVVLLLFALGVEYDPDDLRAGLRVGLPAGLLDAVANFGPGLAAGLVLGWDVRAAVLLGGVTYISSSGVVAKVLGDLGRLGNRETPSILAILVMEDLAMALYLPVVAVLLVGGSWLAGVGSVALALLAVGAVLLVALRHGRVLSRFVFSESDEVLLLTVFGLTLLVAGIAQQLQVSAAVGAFLVGIALSGPVSHRARALVSPLRDLFAATFFLFFGLQVDPGDLPGAAGIAIVLGIVTAGTKVMTGVWSAARTGVGRRGQLRAGAALVARGEFSIVIAGLGVAAGVEADLGPVAAAYVLLLAATGPLLTKYADRFVSPTTSQPL
jgi:CPA2 family monovalent cation:H+ antiporter-2